MSTDFGSFQWPTTGGGGVTVYANVGVFPVTASTGTLVVDASTGNVYEWNGSSWVQVGGPSIAVSLGALDSQAPDARGANLTGGVLAMQSASATEPGLVNTTTQTFDGVKTFGSTISGSVSGNAGTVTTNANLTGPVTSIGNATAIANGAISNAMLANGAVANLSGTNTGDQTITLTGDVTGSGTGSFATTVADVGGASAAAVAGAVTEVAAAASADTVSTLVLRDSSGNFSAGTITASLTGAASLNVLTSAVGAANGVAPLDSGSKVPYANLPSTIMVYLGAWNAATNTPTLADGTGTNGDVYRASVAGTQNLGSGSQTWAIGDFVIYNGSIWQHSPAADGVSSVNGATGAVTVNAINQLTGDVTAGPASGSQSVAATVVSVGGASAANVAATVTEVAAAASADTVSTLVIRDGSGNFSAGTITATLSGNATTATSATTATNLAGGIASEIPYQTAAGATSFIANGTSTNVLISNGTSAPSWGVVVAPAGTLTGTTLNSSVVSSSLTSVGTISGTLTLSGNEARQELVDSTTTGAAATLNSASKSFVILTNASLTSLSMIPAGANGQLLILTNQTGAAITVKNDSGGTAANRITTGIAADLLLSNKASIFLSYDNNTSKWLVVGGSGAGGGAVSPTISKVSTTGYTGNFSAGGSGTYTTPANVSFIKVRMVGGGGGGGPSGTTSGGASGAGLVTYFRVGASPDLLVANGGGAGADGGNNGGAGGSASLGSGPLGTALTGGSGQGSFGNGTSGSQTSGGMGGSSAFGGSGGGGAALQPGTNAAIETGSGGGGAGTTTTSNASNGSGGGAGGYVDAIITSPAVSYAYSVGTGGAGGTLGTSGAHGGDGGYGYIEVTEYYNNGAVGTATNVTGVVAVANGGTGLTASINAKAVASSTAINSVTTTNVVFSTVAWDAQSAYSNGTGKYTVPTTGKYRVASMLYFGSGSLSVSQQMVLYANQSGSASVADVLGNIVAQGTSAITTTVNGSAIFNCVAGDLLWISFYNGTGATITMGGSATNQYVTFEWIGT